jgi:pimeloyl-ACP methyl ester carboxylesterase
MVLTVLVAAALVAGIGYEQVGRARDRKRLPQIGRSVDIGGRTLNISCVGSGTPAVIFESGGDAPGLSWAQLQKEVAKFTEACWYDRAGIGWSDSGPYPRTSAAICTDLHALLKNAGVPPPYVLAGASFGALNSRVYAGMFPNEVAGLVFIDSAHEDESVRAPRFYLARTAPRFLWRPLDLSLRAASFTGLLRLSESSALHIENSPQMSADEMIVALRAEPKSIVTNITTGVVLPESYAEARAITRLGDTPLVVLTAGQPLDFGDPELNRQAQAYQQVWIHEMQAELAGASTRGRQVVVANATHATIPDEVVVDAIRDVLSQIHGGGTKSSNEWGRGVICKVSGRPWRQARRRRT